MRTHVDANAICPIKQVKLFRENVLEKESTVTGYSFQNENRVLKVVVSDGDAIKQGTNDDSS